MFFRVDDDFAFHPKAIAAGNAAIGLWTRAGSWSGQQLSDGFVPTAIVGTLGTTGQASRLCDVGLWVPCQGGYLYHQWEGRQPSRNDVEKKRAENAERLKEWRRREQRM